MLSCLLFFLDYTSTEIFMFLIIVRSGLLVFSQSIWSKHTFLGENLHLLLLIDQVKVAQMVGRIRCRAIRYTDARVCSIDEILTGVRVVKYNGWIAAFLKRISDLRIAELKLITKAAFLRASNSTIRVTTTFSGCGYSLMCYILTNMVL